MPHVAINSSALSDIGLKRHDNQDSYLNDSGLYLVADGMGGGVSGRAASATALSCLGRLANTPIRSRSMIESCIQEAQQQVLGIGETKNSVAGTTLTASSSRIPRSTTRWAIPGTSSTSATRAPTTPTDPRTEAGTSPASRS